MPSVLIRRIWCLVLVASKDCPVLTLRSWFTCIFKKIYKRKIYFPFANFLKTSVIEFSTAKLYIALLSRTRLHMLVGQFNINHSPGAGNL